MLFRSPLVPDRGVQPQPPGVVGHDVVSGDAGGGQCRRAIRQQRISLRVHRSPGLAGRPVSPTHHVAENALASQRRIHRARASERPYLALLLVVEEVKRAVLEEGPAQAEAPLVLDQFGSRNAVEIVLRSEERRVGKECRL